MTSSAITTNHDTNRCLVLCYHSVDPAWPCELAITPEALARQISHLLDRGYEATTFTEAITRSGSQDGGSGGGDQPVLAITFDDGYRAVVDHALPVLDRLGVTASIFVPTAWVGRDRPMSWAGVDQWAAGPHASALHPVDWDQLNQLADAGWEVGSHAATHPMLTLAGDDELAGELVDSKATIEAELGRPCTSIAYPYGNVDPRVMEATRAAGYQAAAGLHPVDPSPDPLNWPRTSIYPVDGAWRYRLKTSAPVRRLRHHLVSRSS